MSGMNASYQDLSHRSKSRKKKSKKKLIIFLIVFLIFVLAIVGYVFKDKLFDLKDNNKEEKKETKVEKKEPEPEPELQIFKGLERPIAVMIDNEYGAWPHAGLQEAYMIYEIIIEGGQTRMMALFKGASTAKIGPIRSSRHYFVEYAMEHSAIYTHFGWSPQAQATITSLGTNNINGINYDGGKFWREGRGYHTSFTSIENLKTISREKSYLLQSSSEPLYKYSVKEYNISNGKDITAISMVYSPSHSVSYAYDETNKVFMRSQRGAAHTDRVTKAQYFAKNLIVMTARNYNIGDGTPRQELVNEGTGTGYYLTNGKSIEITWKKDTRTSKTYFYYADGKEIVLNDGLTFVQVVPEGQSINITYKEPVQENTSPTS